MNEMNINDIIYFSCVFFLIKTPFFIGNRTKFLIKFIQRWRAIRKKASVVVQLSEQAQTHPNRILSPQVTFHLTPRPYNL